jgi:hypothetical protein
MNEEVKYQIKINEKEEREIYQIKKGNNGEIWRWKINNFSQKTINEEFYSPTFQINNKYL